ncbi:sulfate adenylyltransferase subunit CysN [Methylobacterium sp. PvR107]|uniref:sulfate adenylyltransferase subunit CysN n=1 Tax=Methylobacterium sp. PvR107 TaxID=2806597 RepID=UPI001AE5A210|nr:sulfate adenylyltransferase subunit CysN [Methylobacterium sp. PvR107]MBP1178340.1 sulfate adenylyltransferase subunit 1 [Methylobacterium sp. PvR107]
MTLHQAPTAFADRVAGYAAFLTAHRNKAVLRFIACGSVDDGKSTLIGRLLHDTKQIFDDQISALQRDSRKHGTQGQEVDLALLVDGLQAEREQGITIDVAYRFFSTDKRSFIVADTPGHEQYTRNMATGASTADVAVILVDARQGLTRQTRRHALLVSNLGIRRVVLAVNKMDLAGWAQSTFDGIVSGFSEFARGLNFSEVKAIPLSAKNGDNVVDAGVAAPWYTGGTLLNYLETVPVHAEALNAPFRMAVQWVNRPNSEFRGYSGRIASGRVRPGDAVTVQPSGRTSTVARIYTADGDLPEAGEDESVTLVLADQIDVSRGQVIVASAAPMRVTETLDARLFWAAEADLAPGASLFAKIGTATVTATVERIASRIDPETGRPGPAERLSANDIADVSLRLDRAVAVDAYAENRETGSLILIDRETTDTAALGLVLAPQAAPAQAATPGVKPADGGGFLARLGRLFGR